MSDASDRVKKGESLSASLADCRMNFPGSTLEMISVAQESGRLDQELVRLASVTETTLDRQLKTAVALAEAAHAFCDRRCHRLHLHRDGHSDIHLAGLYQIKHPK